MYAHWKSNYICIYMIITELAMDHSLAWPQFNKRYINKKRTQTFEFSALSVARGAPFSSAAIWNWLGGGGWGWHGLRVQKPMLQSSRCLWSHQDVLVILISKITQPPFLSASLRNRPTPRYSMALFLRIYSFLLILSKAVCNFIGLVF